mgnify:CR=1 FL=1
MKNQIVRAPGQPARYRPRSLDDAWRRLGALRRSTALYAVVLVDAPGVTADGNDYPELPGSAGALLSSRLAAAGQDGRSDRAFVAETALPVAGVVRGELQLGITVDSKAP